MERTDHDYLAWGQDRKGSVVDYKEFFVDADGQALRPVDRSSEWDGAMMAKIRSKRYRGTEKGEVAQQRKKEKREHMTDGEKKTAIVSSSVSKWRSNCKKHATDTYGAVGFSHAMECQLSGEENNYKCCNGCLSCLR